MNNSNNLQDISFLAIISDKNNFVINNAFTETLLKTYFKTAPKTQDFTCGIFEKTRLLAKVSKLAKKVKLNLESQKHNKIKGLISYSLSPAFFPKMTCHYPKRTSCLTFGEKDQKGL